MGAGSLGRRGQGSRGLGHTRGLTPMFRRFGEGHGPAGSSGTGISGWKGSRVLCVSAGDQLLQGREEMELFNPALALVWGLSHVGVLGWQLCV